MGSLIRFLEDRIEHEIEARKSKGVRVVDPGAPRSSSLLMDVPENDSRRAIPPLGLREYWYPLVPDSKVGGKKPLYWNILGDDLVLFRDKKGQVAALSDTCAHRGTSLSEGDCFYKGFVSCPYHGATFDGDGSCVAFICEGPDSKMVGNLHMKVYPTRTVRNWVFIWMGEGEPAPIEEDVPPEMFESETQMYASYTYWTTNWLMAIENHSDSHNAFYVHRNSVSQLTSNHAGRDRSPLPPSGRIINNRSIVTVHPGHGYYEVDGKVPYQMYYPGVDGVWPLHTYRKMWIWFFDIFSPRKRAGFTGVFKKAPEEWALGHHLPCAVRAGGGSTRWAIPVDPNLSRIVYFYFTRPKSALGRFWDRVMFKFWRFPMAYNFSGQDNTAATPVRFFTPEHFAPTDSQLIMLRKLITEGSRDAVRRRRTDGNGSGNGSSIPSDTAQTQEPVGSAS